MRFRPIKAAVAVLTVTAMTLPASTKADSITLGASRDATIYQNDPNNSNGAGDSQCSQETTA
jgi:hypothetical protein